MWPSTHMISPRLGARQHGTLNRSCAAIAAFTVPIKLIRARSLFKSERLGTAEQHHVCETTKPPQGIIMPQTRTQHTLLNDKTLIEYQRLHGLSWGTIGVFEVHTCHSVHLCELCICVNCVAFGS